MKENVILEKKRPLNRKISRIYFHVKLTKTFSLQIKKHNLKIILFT